MPAATQPPTAVQGRRTARSADAHRRVPGLVAPSEHPPTYFRSAIGAELHDLDGNLYVDFAMPPGLLLGHAHPAIVSALQQAAADGLAAGPRQAHELRVAELLLERLGSTDSVLLAASGEARSLAVALARRHTRRPLLVRWEGDDAVNDEDLVLPVGDEVAMERLFAQHGPRLAAALIERLPTRTGLRPHAPPLLPRLRQLCDQHGVLLILDEQATSLRLPRGRDDAELQADLRIIGSVVGGGLPAAALVGRRELLTALPPGAPAQPLALAAGRALLQAVAESPLLPQLDKLGEQLDALLGELRARVSWLQWRRAAGLFWLHLDDGPLPERPGDISAVAMERYDRLRAPLLDRGILLPVSPLQPASLCSAHTPVHLERLAAALHMSCREQVERS